MTRIALLDSGVDKSIEDSVFTAAAFIQKAESRVATSAASGDQLSHGTALAKIILSEVPTAQLLIAQIFMQKFVCTPLQVAAGLDWAVSQGAQLVNMSLGLSNDRAVLRQACARALAEGVILVAASPARGSPVFPAAYSGVIRATGDARCQTGEISFLDSPQADFGGCIQSSVAAVSGASVGCASVTAKIASCLSSGVAANRHEVWQWLVQHAHYQGRESRSS